MSSIVYCPGCRAKVVIPESGQQATVMRCPTCGVVSPMPGTYDDRRPARRRPPARKKNGLVSLIGVGATGLLVLLAVMAIQGGLDEVRKNLQSQSNDEQQQHALANQQFVVPAPPEWRTFTAADNRISFQAPIELDRATPEAGIPDSLFTTHCYRGEDGDLIYGVVVETKHRPDPEPKSDAEVERMCGAIIRNLNAQGSILRMRIAVGSRPGIQIAFFKDDRHHIGRMVYTGKHAYYWDVSGSKPIASNAPRVGGFLDSVVIVD